MDETLIFMEDLWTEKMNKYFESQIRRLDYELEPETNDVEVPENRKEFRCSMKLDFKSNKSHPAMADNLRIEINDAFGRHIVAGEDIEVGKTVVVEEHFMKSLSPVNEQYVCDTCFEKSVKFISCSSCDSAKFCDNGCKNANEAHNLVCQMPFDSPLLYTSETVTQLKLLMDTITLVVRHFPTLNNLIAFVHKEVHRTPQQKRLLKSTSTFVARYRTFLMLHSCKFGLPAELVYLAVSKLMAIPFIANRFRTSDHLIFLMSLVAHHELILRGNSFSDKQYATIGIVVSLFNHSCNPNLVTCSSGRFRYVTTLRPVKKGEQLFINYCGGEARSTKERQNFLENNFGFRCRCDKCETRPISLKDKYRILMDWDYLYLGYFDTIAKFISLQPFCLQSYVEKRKDAIATSCVNVLNRHGRGPWTERLDFVTDLYQKIRFTDTEQEYGFEPFVTAIVVPMGFLLSYSILSYFELFSY